MAMNKAFTIHKPKAEKPFLQINESNIGKAAGILKPCGLKLYLYLCSNENGFEWKLNATAYKKWLQTESDEASVRKAIRDGLADLIENKYIIDKGKEIYDFYEVQQS